MARYQMSCWSETRQAKKKRWCGHCSKCARIYIFFLALGLDPKTVDFKDEMLSSKNRRYYSIFDKADGGLDGYDATRLGRDEQILAFYLAYKRGLRGGIMNDFIRERLTEAGRRERELRHTFFSLYPANTVPEELKPQVLSIFKRELKHLK